MKNIFLLSILMLAGIISKAQKAFVNDPNATVRKVSGSFNAIKISGGIDLYLSQYESESIAVSASSDNFKENIKTVIENNTLKIYYNGGQNWTSGNKKLKVYVSFITLENLQVSGACDVQVAGTILVPELQVGMSGASQFKGEVKVDNLQIDLSGASDLKISGTATNVSVKSSGASDLKGYDLVADVCTARASGASDINITVNKELNVNASGASDIFYKGSAVIKDMHSSGASTVSKKG